MKKIVIIIGSRMKAEFQSMKNKFQKEFGIELEDDPEVLVIGNGEIAIEDLDLEKFKDQADPDAFLNIIAHGYKKSDGKHYIDNKNTEDFLKAVDLIVNKKKAETKEKTQTKKIAVGLFSCNSGDSPKNARIAPDMALVTSTGSKYTTSDQSELRSIWLKKHGFSNHEIYNSIIQNSPETMYYNPPIAEDELKKEQKNKLDKKAKESSEHQSKIIKFTRPGKFTSAELYKTLEENKDSFGDKLEEIYAELSGFFSSNPKKTTVSVAKVKNILNVTNNPQDECEQFIAILKLHLAEKLKPEKIREELDKRMIENSEEQRDLLEEKKQKSLSEESKKSPFTRQLTGEELETDYLRMAIGRNLSDEVEVILKNNPEIFNSERYKIHTALLDALNNNSTEIFRLVLNVITPAQKENLINIRGRDQGNTILIEACLNQEMDITEEIGELINTKGINFDLENKKGETALEIAVQRSFSDNRFVNIAAQIILAKRKVQTHMELGQEENYGQDINEEVERLESLELEELLKLKLNDDPSTSITGVNRGKSRSETKTRG